MKLSSKDAMLRQMLDFCQLALKLIANVTFGYTSASFSGRMPCIDVADSIVGLGRRTTENAKTFIEREWTECKVM
jgi:DNA polymerase zeta